MEKKGTRIAYFIALAIVVIALVIAKVANDGSGFVATGWALFPPIVAIALALISKEVYSSLFLGCVVGALLLANFQPWQMVVNFIGAGECVGMINAIQFGYGDNVFLVCFVGVLSAVGGGLIRDIFVDRKPVILQKEIYATAAMAGSLFYYYGNRFLPGYLSSSIAMALIFFIRVWSLHRDINLPLAEKNSST